MRRVIFLKTKKGIIMKTCSKNIFLLSMFFCMTMASLHGMRRRQSMQRAIERNSSATELKLFLVNIDEDGIEYLINYLIENPSITTLRLRRTYLRDEGATAISEGLSSSSITDLNLEENKIGAEGATAIAAALASSSLIILNLRLNKIGPEGATALAEALQNSSLTTLILGLNGIGLEGATAIAQALPNSSLTYLKLYDIGMGDVGKKVLRQLRNFIKIYY